MGAKEHHQTAHHLDGVADEHDLTFRSGVGKRAHKRRQHHVKQGEHGHQSGALPLVSATGANEFNSRDKQRVVGQRAEKLGRHDGVKTALHEIMQ